MYPWWIHQMPWFHYEHSLLYTAANSEELWTAAIFALLAVIPTKQRSSQSLGTKHLHPSRGDSLRQSHRQRVRFPTALTVSLTQIKQRCHFHFNMQRSLDGMLNGGEVIKRTALTSSQQCRSPTCFGTRYERLSYPTSKLRGCCRMSRCSAYRLSNIY